MKQLLDGVGKFYLVSYGIEKYLRGELEALRLINLLKTTYSMLFETNKLQEDGSFYLSFKKISSLTGLTRRKYERARNVLLEKDLISIEVRSKNEGKEKYKIQFFKLNVEKYNQIILQDNGIKLEDIEEEENELVQNIYGGSAKIEPEVVQKMHGGSAKTRPNINTKYKDIDINTRYNINSNFTPDGVIGASSDPSVPVPNEFKFNPLDKWNEIAERYKLPTVNVISKQRLSKLKQRFKNIGGEDEFWAIVAKAIEASPFLQGQNNRKWRANLDFFLQESSFIKAAEGVYSHGNLLEEPDKPLEDKKKDDVLAFFFD